jgi:hypothetical protein
MPYIQENLLTDIPDAGCIGIRFYYKVHLSPTMAAYDWEEGTASDQHHRSGGVREPQKFCLEANISLIAPSDPYIIRTSP